MTTVTMFLQLHILSMSLYVEGFENLRDILEQNTIFVLRISKESTNLKVTFQTCCICMLLKF